LEIRELSADWIDAATQLERVCFSQPWSRDALQAQLENPNAVFRVAVQDGELMGYIGMHRVLDEGYIANVAVDPKFRRRGVARELLGTLIAFARRERLAFLTLEVRAGNRPAAAFYQNMGFGEAGRRRGYYENPREDAVLMTLFL
jgi:ribosomal-protein-alanine N-acetyltransferase